MTEEKKTCMDCKFRLSQDFGCSNYTVEGTTFYCLFKKHPGAPFDEFYGEDKRLAFAEQCDGYVKGKGTNIDCDRDSQKEDGNLSAYTDDPEIVALLDQWHKSA